MNGRILRSLAGAAALMLISVATASAQAPVLTATIAGSSVTFNWTPTAGALGYRLDGGVAPGAYSLAVPLGPVTTFGVPSLANGVYFARLVALPGGETSNEVRVQLPSPPATPTNLQVVRNGTAIVAVWTPGAGGGPVSAYQLRAGSTSGASDIATVPVAGTSFGVGGVPAAGYFLRVVAVNGAGASAESNEVAINMPAGGACDAPPTVSFQSSVFSTFLALSWTPVPTAVNYLLSASFNGVPVVSDQAFGTVNSLTRRGNALGIYDVSVKAVFSCGAVGAPATTRLVLDGAPPPGPRTADPAPGQSLPVPSYFRSVVDEMANARPDLLRNSCLANGGNNRWLFELTKRLRDRDNRWGNNIKRCNEGMSQDIVTYNTSALPDEGARANGRTTERNMRLFDVIGGHCGGAPGPNYTDVTPDTVNGGACAEWTLQYYLAAGYTP
ncbi:MAG: fibronectin type III domain-containing protein [Acidobacteriota bacterium]